MHMLAKLPARRWWYLMPIIFITYSLAYLDRANYGFAAAAELKAIWVLPKERHRLLARYFSRLFLSGTRRDICGKTQRAKNDFL